MSIVKLKSRAGRTIEFHEEMIGQGGIKDVYMSPDHSYVVAFFRNRLDAFGRDRIEAIVGPYRDAIFNREGGEYWKDLFCWPNDILEWDGRLGIVAPVYKSHFFFEHGSKNNDFLGIKGKEKQGKWFASAKNRNKFLDPRERGNWLSYFRLCIRIARAVRRLHAAGLAHSDLSYRNVLVDPVGGNASIIDIDGLVVPGKFPPEVVGTPDFIAPEVMASINLKPEDRQRKLPSISTDRHALAVLIYMYLLYRHPLRGGKVHNPDPTVDENLSMGAHALFIENPHDKTNRINPTQAEPNELPWADTARVPYTITGPLLSSLFARAFVDGLHDPIKRPTADEWEQALVRTVDLMQPCLNPSCELGWYVFDNTAEPRCPICSTPFRGKLPVLNLYSARRQGKFTPDNHKLMVYTNQSLFPWHVNRLIAPNEKLRGEHRRRVGYFVFHMGMWLLVNENLPDLHDTSENKPIALGSHVALRDGQQLLFSKTEGGRLAVVQLVDC